MDTGEPGNVAGNMGEVSRMSRFFFPELRKVEALEPYRLRTYWNTGEVLDVDVESVLRSSPELEDLLLPEVFARVHVGEWGGCVEWKDSELGADNVYAWAKEQAGEVSHEMFGDWMRRNDLSLTTAAAALGMSRRMMAYCRTAEKPIPRHVWLACLGWEVMGGKDGNGASLPLRLPISGNGTGYRATV